MLPKYHKRNGHDVFIIASTLSFDENGNACNVVPGRYENEYGIPVRRLAYKRHLPAFLAKFLRLYEPFLDTVEQICPDVMFIHGCQFLDIYKLLPYLRKNKVTVYVDNHADFSNSATNFLSKNILHKFLWRRCAKAIEPFTRTFYGVLPARVDFLKDIYHLPQEKVKLLVMGVDDEMVESLRGCREIFREKHGIKDETVVITGGKIDESKTQVITFLRLMREQEDPSVTVLVFGSIIPGMKDQVLSLCDGKRIQYLGWLDHLHIYEALISSDLAVYPGRHSVLWEETVGIGLPMVVKRWDGTTHVDLGGNVLFLNDDSRSTMELVMKAAFDQLNQMRAIAREKGRDVFSYRNIALRAIQNEQA
jgi:hypothetical protein